MRYLEVRFTEIPVLLSSSSFLHLELPDLRGNLGSPHDSNFQLHTLWIHSPCPY